MAWCSPCYEYDMKGNLLRVISSDECDSLADLSRLVINNNKKNNEAFLTTTYNGGWISKYALSSIGRSDRGAMLTVKDGTAILSAKGEFKVAGNGGISKKGWDALKEHMGEGMWRIKGYKKDSSMVFQLSSKEPYEKRAAR